MHFEDRKQGDVLIIKIVNTKLDVRNAMEFREKLLSHVNEGEQSIVVNLSHVEFITAAARRNGFEYEIYEKNSNLILSDIREGVKRMDRIFKLIDSEEEAVAFLAG